MYEKDLNLDSSARDCSSKLRSTFYSLVDCGIYCNGLNPQTSKRIYQTIILPKALYGCELWNGLTESQIMTMEIAHRHCIKRLQSMPKSVRTDVALSFLNVLPLENIIDKKKLLFFGQLCRLRVGTKIKSIFVYRVFHFLNNPRKSKGFIPDIFKILGKYKLSNTINEYLRTGYFPSKSSWKTIVRESVLEKSNADLQLRMVNDQDLYMLFDIHNEYHLSCIWEFSRLYPVYRKQCITAAVALSRLFSREYEIFCPLCNMVTDNMVLHSIMYCTNTKEYRLNLWVKLINLLGVENYHYFCSLSPKYQTASLLSGMTFLVLDCKTRIQCFKLVLTVVHKMCKVLMSPELQ